MDKSRRSILKTAPLVLTGVAGCLGDSDGGGNGQETPQSTPEPTPTPPPDSDGDGVPDEEDDFPNDPTYSQDSDGDGVPDPEDDLPQDSRYSEDSDGDGVPDPEDDFPNDPQFSEDSDGDGVPNPEDDFPNDPNISEEICTDVEVTELNYDSVFLGDDAFDVSLINRGDVAGEIIVEITLYESESKTTLVGTFQDQVSIGAQTTKEITIRGEPPSEASYYSGTVTEQDCTAR